MRCLFTLVICFLPVLAYCQKPCFPFQIGNGLSFRSDNLILVSKPIDKKDRFGKPIYQIFLHEKEDNGWSKEQSLPFSSGQFTDYHPEAYGDTIVFFISRRPEPEFDKGFEYGNLWYVNFKEGAWSEPRFIYELNQKGHDTYPSLTKSGNLYFNSDRSGGEGSMDIYVSKFEHGSFSYPEPVSNLNSEDSENDLVVDPMERFIIFNRYNFKTKELDLFASIKKGKQWSDPKELPIINSQGVFELTPTLSLDGSMFYYEVNSQVFCIKTSLILESIE